LKRFLKFAGISALLVSVFVVWFLTRDRAPPRPHPIAVAADTTRITAPLTPSGYPDYYEALEQSASRGVTPQNNAAILVLQARGCTDLSGKDRREFFRRLGIPPFSEDEPEDGKRRYLTSWHDFVDQLPAEKVPPYVEPMPAAEEMPADDGLEPDPVKDEPAEPSLPEPASPETEIPDLADIEAFAKSSKGRERLQSLEERTEWTPAELQLATEWVAQQKAPLQPLDKLEERTHFYIPMLRAADKRPLIYADASQKTALRQAVEVLRMRALVALHREQLDDAWADIKRILYLSKLTRKQPELISVLISNAVHSSGGDVLRRLLGNPKLNAEQVARIQKEFAELSGLPDFVAALDQGDRYLYLDFVRALAEVGPNAISDKPAPAGSYLDQGRMLDYDVMMRLGNEWYDRFSKVMSLHGEDAQVAKNQYEQDFDDYCRNTAPYGEALLPTVMALKGRTGLSEKMADIILNLTMTRFTILNNTQRTAVAHQTVIRTGCALHLYRAKHGRFPEKLEALVPEFLAEPAIDMHHYTPVGQPEEDHLLQYKTDGKGFLLYGFGYGGDDHGGYELGTMNLSIYTPDFQPQKPQEESTIPEY
jgi:hypothetical protein